MRQNRISRFAQKRLKKLMTILLLTAVVALQLGSRWIIYASFKANQAYIARELCENKAKPQMHCNGRCHLKKQLAKEQEQERKAPRPVVPEEVPAAPLPEPIRIGYVLPTAAEVGTAVAFAPYRAGMPTGCTGAVWQPPRI